MDDSCEREFVGCARMESSFSYHHSNRRMLDFFVWKGYEICIYMYCIFKETAMGTKLDSIAEEDRKNYIDNIKEMSKCFIKRFVRLWLHPPLLFSLSEVGRVQSKCLQVLHTFTNNVIKERRSIRCKNNLSNTKNRTAMLDLLLAAESEGKINNDGIREEVDTFMFEVIVVVIFFLRNTFENRSNSRATTLRRWLSVFV
jgi:hypothetical protein